MSSGRQQPTLGVQFLRQRMHDLGYSQRKLATRAGVPHTVVAAMIRREALDTLTWRELLAVANGLDVDMRWLLSTPADEVDESEDDVMLEAAILAAPRALGASRLADALGWELSRVVIAADELEIRLRATGAELRRQEPGYQSGARPNVLKPAQRRRLSQVTSRVRRGLRGTAVRVLRDIINDPDTSELLRVLTNDERAALGELKREGIVDWQGAEIMLSDDTREGLDLTLPRIEARLAEVESQTARQ